jgi:hypothetical protein
VGLKEKIFVLMLFNFIYGTMKILEIIKKNDAILEHAIKNQLSMV